MHFDVVILGSGFSGSLLAWILAKHGRKVALIDRTSHPRFALGESSTPLADFLLEQIAQEFELPEILPLTRWGTWQSHYPELVCGKKRGFSYFKHRNGEHFQDSEQHEASLLVAASSSDSLSDTHWLRSDVDAWFCSQASKIGVRQLMDSKVEKLIRGEPWKIRVCPTQDRANSQSLNFTCNVVVDSSGRAGLMGRALQIARRDSELHVRTGAIFGHLKNVESMDQWLNAQGSSDLGEPFYSDDAAQHHLVDEGWIWMLRFNNAITSVGFVANEQFIASHDPAKLWAQIRSRYPTIDALLSGSELVAPRQNGFVQWGNLRRSSRLWAQAAGSNWFMLPGTVGVIDPLHSTGIAHALSGVRRIARTLLGKTSADMNYADDVPEELKWIDQIVAIAYQAKAINFQLFTAACTLYFVAAIHCERNMAVAGQMPEGFLCWKNTELRKLVGWFQSRLHLIEKQTATEGEQEQVLEQFRRKLEPWNDVGLLDPSLHNRIARSSAPKA